MSREEPMIFLGPIKVFWYGLWRIRKLRQVRYYNRVKWFLDEGYSKEDIKKFLNLEKLEPLRQRLDKEGWHGSRRNRRLTGKKKQIRLALEAHK